MNFDNKVKNILYNLDLTEIQSAFYLTLLRSGGLSVSKVAKLLGINRTNSYTIIEKLKLLDLIWEENKINGKTIHAKSSNALLKALDKKEKEYKNYKSEIVSLSSVFNSFKDLNKENYPKIRIYEGKKGLISLSEDIIKESLKSKEILLFSNQESEKNIFGKKYHDEFIKIRKRKKIKIKVLAIENEAGKKLQNKDKSNLRETKFLPRNFDFQSEIYLYDNKICLLDLKEEIIGTIIESEELYKIHTQIFKTLWNFLK